MKDSLQAIKNRIFSNILSGEYNKLKNDKSERVDKFIFKVKSEYEKLFRLLYDLESISDGKLKLEEENPSTNLEPQNYGNPTVSFFLYLRNVKGKGKIRFFFTNNSCFISKALVKSHITYSDPLKGEENKEGNQWEETIGKFLSEEFDEETIRAWYNRI